VSIAKLLETPAGEVAGRAVPALDKDFSLAEALERIERAKTDRAVLTADGRPQGMMTLRDVIFKLATARTKQAYIGGLHASNFMSEPLVSVGPSTTLREALEKMDMGGFTSVPVVTEDSLEGVITRVELAKLVAEEPEASDVPVRDVMRSFIVSVDLQARVLHVRQLLADYDLSVVPVVDEGRFLGVVGVDEIARVFIAYYELARGEPKRHTPLKYVVVADAVKLRPPRVDPDASLAEAADKMASSRYRVVVVVDGDKPVGFVSGLEIARALLARA
jgi:CBS domain-containing protein